MRTAENGQSGGGAAAGEEEALTIIESMCPKCQENGETRLLPHRIPYFRTVLISSFSCPHCSYHNNAVEPISDLQPFGERIELKVLKVSDLDRQIVKSDQASVSLPELDFEIPKTTLGGISSTIQGIVLRAADDLSNSQEARRLVAPEVAHQVEAFIKRLRTLVEAPAAAGGEASAARQDVKEQFHIIIDDPSGNSYIENPNAPKPDSQLKIEKYKRTIEQLHAMGYYEEQSEAPFGGGNTTTSGGATTTTTCHPLRGADLPESQQSHTVWDLSKALPTSADVSNATATFVIPCCHCGKDGSQNMCEIDVPGFRKCWVMAFVCEFCGAKSNEVKVAGSYGVQGREWSLDVCSDLDINRDILKSDTASIKIPSLDLELEPGTLGGVFTTVEGLLTKIAEEIDEKMPFHGDSQLEERRAKIEHIVTELKAMAAGQRYPFKLILDDLADLSHIGRRDDEILFLTGGGGEKKEGEEAGSSSSVPTDHELKTRLYDRSEEQNDFLGLNDMKTENYETDS